MPLILSSEYTTLAYKKRENKYATKKSVPRPGIIG